MKSVHDGQKTVYVITEDNIERVRDMVLFDRRVTIDAVAHVLQISHGAAYELMHNKLGFHEVCAKWVPKQLTEVHKQTSVDIYINIWIAMVTNEIYSYTESSLMTKHYKPESKRQSMEWKPPQSPCNIKLKNPTIRRKTHAYRVLGLTRPTTGTLSREGHYNKHCAVQ